MISKGGFTRQNFVASDVLSTISKSNQHHSRRFLWSRGLEIKPSNFGDENGPTSSCDCLRRRFFHRTFRFFTSIVSTLIECDKVVPCK